jgi:hypothetical protein
MILPLIGCDYFIGMGNSMRAGAGEAPAFFYLFWRRQQDFQPLSAKLRGNGKLGRGRERA